MTRKDSSVIVRLPSCVVPKQLCRAAFMPATRPAVAAASAWSLRIEQDLGGRVPRRDAGNRRRRAAPVQILVVGRRFGEARVIVGDESGEESIAFRQGCGT